MTSGPLLRASGVQVTYPNGAHALRGIDLSVAEGECVAVVGESGCGKTSLARAILGLLPARAAVTGSITMAGSGLPTRPRARRRLLGTEIGYVPQDPYTACDPLRSIADHVREAWRAVGRRPPPGAVAALLGDVGLDPGHAALRPHQCSGGMLQRATIAAATALRPGLIVADEPTSALDADRREEILRLLRARGGSLLLISHDLRAVAAYADRVLICYAGRVIETGPAEAVLARPRHPFTRALLAATPRPGGPLPAPLPGAAPDPRRPDRGCAFAPRCPIAASACRHRVPDLADGLACPVADRDSSAANHDEHAGGPR